MRVKYTSRTQEMVAEKGVVSLAYLAVAVEVARALALETKKPIAGLQQQLQQKQASARIVAAPSPPCSPGSPRPWPRTRP